MYTRFFYSKSSWLNIPFNNMRIRYPTIIHAGILIVKYQPITSAIIKIINAGMSNINTAIASIIIYSPVFF